MDDGNYSSGVRGFLEWLDEQQPGISAKVKTQLPTKVPGAFSAYHAGGWQTAGMSPSQAAAVSAQSTLGAYRRMGGLGDVSFDNTPPLIATTQDITNAAATVPPIPIEVTQAADDSSTSTSITDAISGVVKGISSLYLTKQQADIQQQVVNTQLARAAAGLPPLPTSLANLGVPQVSVGLSTGTGTALLIGGGIIAALLLFGGVGRARR
jgi:hypothetical protein